MNETIGVKGGKQDRKRSLRIKQKQKKKLQEYEKRRHKKELADLEKRVKHIQRVTLIKTLPIVIPGEVIKTLTEKASPKIEKKSLEEKNNAVITPSNISKKTSATLSKKNIHIISIDEFLPSEDKKDTKNVSLPATNLTKKQAMPSYTEEKSAQLPQVEVKLAQQDEIPIKKAPSLPKKPAGFENDPLTLSNIETIENLKKHKIIEVYETKLKEIRYDLRKLIFEYNAYVTESDKLYESKKAQELLDKLSDVIKKIEELKVKIRIENLDKYDDNYIYTLIEKYLEEFKNNKFVSEIKDSDLYQLIEKKLTELDTKKDKLNKKVEQRKDELVIKEVNLDKLKEKYYDYEKYNNLLLNFQYEQDKALKELKEKIDQAVTIEEKVKVEVQAMTEQSRRLMRLLAWQLFLPGVRGAKRLTTAAALYLYYLNNVINPRTKTTKYKVIKVQDYSKSIENSLKEIDNVENLLNKTSKQLDRTINNFKREYEDFLGILPECDELLYHFEKVKEQLKEKEFEIERIKKAQQKSLERNNAKVLKYNDKAA